jgi:SAM-dependent methyltransferase
VSTLARYPGPQGPRAARPCCSTSGRYAVPVRLRGSGRIATVREHRDSAFLAGGTTEVDLVRQNVLRPGLLVDINDLPLNRVEDLPEGAFASVRWQDEQRRPGGGRAAAVPGHLAGAAAESLGAASEHGLDGRQPVPAGPVQLLPRCDVAVANMVLHHAPDPARMLAEMARIVRPGGTIAVTDAVEHPYEWMRIEQADIWLGFTPEQVKGYFQQNRLAEYGYSSLGMQ